MAKADFDGERSEAVRQALESSARCNHSALRKAVRRISQLYDDALAPSGLRGTQRSILNHICRAGAPTISELAEDLVLDRGALTHNLKPLERDGLVRTEVDPDDRRVRRITLSPAGYDKLRDTYDMWVSAQRAFEATFGETQAATLRAMMGQIVSSDFEEKFRRTAGVAR